MTDWMMLANVIALVAALACWCIYFEINLDHMLAKGMLWLAKHFRIR